MCEIGAALIFVASILTACIFTPPGRIRVLELEEIKEEEN